MLRILGVIALLGCSVVTAAADCTPVVVEPARWSCAASGSDSADFTSGCSYVPAVMECRGGWISVPSTQAALSHAQFCAGQGLSAGDDHGQICGSGERRPPTGGTVSEVPSFSRDGKHYCWAPGQKRDYDVSDVVTQYYCD